MSKKTKEIPVPITCSPEDAEKITPLLTVVFEEFCKPGFTILNALSLVDSIIFFISQRAEADPKEVASELLRRAAALQEAFECGDLMSREPAAVVDLRVGDAGPNPDLH